MAFTHGKNARLWVDQYELTNNFTEFAMAAKAGTAETTVFGRGAKTFIGGLKEGTINAKGFFDPAANQEDFELSSALGRGNNMNITFVPTGATTVGTRAVIAYAAETDYTISNPVNNVVAVSFAGNADSGLATGILLDEPTGAAVTTAATFGAPLNVNWSLTALPALGAAPVTITASGSTAGFLSSGAFIAAGGTVSTPGVYAYTGLAGSTFTGVTALIPAVGAANSSTTLSQGLQDSIGQSSIHGLVVNFHCLTITGTGANGTLTPKIQHSADGVTWVDLIGGGGSFTFSQPVFNTTTAPSGAGATVGLVPANTTINPYLRLVVITTIGTTFSTTYFASAARQ